MTRGQRGGHGVRLGDMGWDTGSVWGTRDALWGRSKAGVCVSPPVLLRTPRPPWRCPRGHRHGGARGTPPAAQAAPALVTLRPPPGRGPRPAAAGPIEAAGPPRRAGSVDGRGPVVSRGSQLPLCKYKPDYLPAGKRSGRALSHHVLSQPAPTGGRADRGGTRDARRGKRGGPMTGGTLRQWDGGAGRGGHLTGTAPERRHGECCGGAGRKREGGTGTVGRDWERRDEGHWWELGWRGGALRHRGH